MSATFCWTGWSTSGVRCLKFLMSCTLKCIGSLQLVQSRKLTVASIRLQLESFLVTVVVIVPDGHC